MIRSRWPVFLLLLVCCPAQAHPLRNRHKLARTQHKLAGQVLDFTRNHGEDNRIWSAALCELRDMYVYLPPGYDPHNRYPLVIWLHGFAQDEVSFLDYVIVPLDRAMACGKLPPMIIAAPDGSLLGRASIANAASFFINSKAGAYEDYLMGDVWNFLHEQFPIRPERDAHIIAGVSMGGGAAYAKAFKFRDRFATVVGVFPPLNTRWENDRGRYRANFDPDRWGVRTNFNKPFEVVARFHLVMTIRLGSILRPLYERGADIADQVRAENPLDLLVDRNIQDGEFAMYVAYGGKDQFNLDAQVESFLYVAKERGIHITVAYDPRGRHDARTALSFLPGIVEWLDVQLARYKTPMP